MKNNLIKGIVLTLGLSLGLSVFQGSVNVRATEKTTVNSIAISNTNDEQKYPNLAVTTEEKKAMKNRVVVQAERKIVNKKAKEVNSSISKTNTIKEQEKTKSNYLATEDGLYKVGDYYYYISNGQKVKGWQKINQDWYYFDANYGYMRIDTIITVGTDKYYIDEDGKMTTGWVADGGSYYYFNNSGAMVKGWQTIGGQWYYFDKSSGNMASDTERYIDGNWYYFNEDGEMVKGPVHHNGSNYLYGNDGARISKPQSWIKFNNNWYHTDKDGEIYVGYMVYIDNAYYAFDGYGRMVTSNWYETVDNNWHYLGADGKAHIGWLKVDNKWYYFNSNGNMCCDGVFSIYGKREHFNKDGQWIGTW